MPGANSVPRSAFVQTVVTESITQAPAGRNAQKVAQSKTMKVLKKGRPQKGWAKEYKCSGIGNGMGGCGAELLVEQDDLFQTSSSARDDTTYYITFKCPECGVLTDLSNELGLYAVKLPTAREWAEAHPARPTEAEVQDLNSAP